MDTAAWFATIAPLDDRDAAFLRTLLLTESPRVGDASSAFVHSAPGGFGHADAEKEDDSDGPTPPSPPTSTSDQHEDERPVKKRKRRSTWRPKQEIDRLRRSVADLEAIIAVQAQRPSAMSQQPNGDDMTSVAPACNAWKNVAARQFQRRRDSERENYELRNRVEQQLAVVKSLARIVQRAHQGLPSEEIPRTVMPVDARLFASKRQELLTAVAMLFDSLDNIHPDSLFCLRDEEFRMTEKLTMPRDLNIEPGTLLAQSCEKRFVPSAFASLGDLLWARAEIADSQHALYKVQDLECLGGNYISAFSFELPTEYGHTRYNGVRARARRRDASRDAIAVVASIWPDAASPAQVQGSGYELRASTVIHPYSRSKNLNEVLVNIECARLVPPTASSQLTPQQAGMLDGIVSTTHKFALDQHDQYIDSVLLQELDGVSVS